MIVMFELFYDFNECLFYLGFFFKSILIENRKFKELCMKFV